MTDLSNTTPLFDAAVASIAANEQSMSKAKSRYNANKMPCYIDTMLYRASVTWSDKVANNFKSTLKAQGVSGPCTKRYSENTKAALKHIKGLNAAAKSGDRDAVESVLNENGIATEADLKRAAKLAANPSDPIDRLVAAYKKLNNEDREEAMSRMNAVLPNEEKAEEEDDDDDDADVAVAA